MSLADAYRRLFQIESHSALNNNPNHTSPHIIPTAAEHAAMRDAIVRALTAAKENGKAGIAAAIMRNGQIVATGENEVQLRSDPTQHAEMVAITRASTKLDKTNLFDCTMISTLQPCEMCLSAIRFAGISRIIFAATQANVPHQYFAFPHLRIEDFQNGEFGFAGGVEEDLVLHLYIDGGD